MYWGISCLYDNFEASSWQVFVVDNAWKTQPNEVDKNAVSVVRTNSHCKEEVVGIVEQKPRWLYPCFYPSPIVLTKSLETENVSIMEVNTNAKARFHFYGPEKTIKLAKNKIK